ncbi:MAG: hypothetical protein V2I24_11930 [Halieaceae bacterium]|jgi:hypothetical protein|nr:hypothetical protein [Halieaceae bacterium]
MSKALRTTLLIVLVVVVLGAAALFYLASNLNGIVAGLIEEQGSIATQTDVRVSGVDIRLREGSAEISGLSVANPEGFSGSALELGHFAVQLDAGSLTKDTIIVKNVLVDSARINVVQQGSANNLQKLLDSLPQSGDSGTTAETGESKKVIIEKFTLSGASASVTAAELGEPREVTLPTIVVTDIGRASNGATGTQVAQQILRPIIEKALTSAAAEEIKGRAIEKIDEALGGALKKLGGR